MNNQPTEFNQERLIETNIRKCIQHTAGNVTLAATKIGIDRRTLQRRMKQFGITRKPLQ